MKIWPEPSRSSATMQEPIQVSDIREVAVSRSWLSGGFKSRWAARRPRRSAASIWNAKQLLADTDMPVPEVAIAAGFRSREYLAYAFKQATGLSPRQYRSQVRPIIGRAGNNWESGEWREIEEGPRKARKARNGRWLLFFRSLTPFHLFLLPTQ